MVEWGFPLSIILPKGAQQQLLFAHFPLHLTFFNASPHYVFI